MRTKSEAVSIVYISFIVPDDSTAQASCLLIDAVVRDLFPPGAYAREYISAEEIIYSLTSNASDKRRMSRELFGRLEDLFAATRSLLPHFTQMERSTDAE